MKKIVTSSLVAAAVALPLTAAAAQWTINAGGGWQEWDGERDLDGAATAVVGIERSLGTNWAVELRGMYSEPENDYNVSALDTELLQVGLDFLHYFGGGKWQPYYAFGLGYAEFDRDGKGLDDPDETQANLGGGIRYSFSKHWSTRFDLRAINSLDEEQTDGLASLVIGLSFGGSDKAAPAPAPAPKPMVQDADGDGVADSADQCANTPAGVAVDAKGCALDTDADGVADYMDKCPKTPAGRQVDENGCKYVLTRTEEIKLNVQFASNSSDIPAAYQAEIEKVAVFMKKFGGASAVIEGHSDSSGSDAYNKKLSQRRADSVKAELVTRYGIDAARLTAIGYGEERPIATNDTAEGRKTNRRVVAVLKAEVSE